MGKNAKTGGRILLLGLLLGGSLLAAADDTLEFRAWRDGKPVSGLQARDMKLIVNGSERQVSVLAEVRQKLAVSDATPPRLVTLLFNLSDFKLDLDPALDFIFASVLRPNDRLLVRSNNFSLADHALASPASEKKRLRQILDFEKRKYKVLYQSVRFQLTDLLNSTARLMSGQASDGGFAEPEAGNQQGVYPEAIRRNFIHVIVQTVQAYKKFFLNMDEGQLRRLAEYLRLQDAEKWGFVFFERPNFFIPEPQSLLAGYLSPSELFRKMHQEFYVADNLNDVGIGKSFIGSGTWSTMLLTATDRIPLAVASEKGTLRLDRSSIASAGERVFPQISRSTGGVVMDANPFEDFFAQVASSEDLFYRLSFAADPASPFRSVALTAAAPCELVYDDQRHPARPAATGPMPAAPQIAGVEVKGTGLQIKMSAQPAPAAGKQAPRIFISVQLFDGKMNMVFNKTVEGDAAAAETASLEVSLPALAKGVYDLVIEATDAVTRKNDLALFSLSVSKKGMQI